MTRLVDLIITSEKMQCCKLIKTLKMSKSVSRSLKLDADAIHDPPKGRIGTQNMKVDPYMKTRRHLI